MAKTRNKKHRGKRSEFALSDIRKRTPTGQYSRAGRPAKARPPKRLMERRKALLGDKAGCTECWIDVGFAQGLLTVDQANALQKYSKLAAAYQAVIDAPKKAVDILAGLQPRTGGGMQPEEAQAQIMAWYREARAAIENASSRDVVIFDLHIGQTVWPSNGTFVRIRRVAEHLVDHFKILRRAA